MDHEAAARRLARRPEPRHIDYDRMNREFPKQKAALTRAINSGDYDKVIATCAKTVAAWNEIGAWPDDWARWNCALDDAYWAAWRRYINDETEVRPVQVTLDDLPLLGDLI